jgi:hypothetical protein
MIVFLVLMNVHVYWIPRDELVRKIKEIKQYYIHVYDHDVHYVNYHCVVVVLRHAMQHYDRSKYKNE